MRSAITGSKLASLYQLTKQQNVFASLPELTKHNADGPFIYRDRKKVSISILFKSLFE